MSTQQQFANKSSDEDEKAQAFHELLEDFKQLQAVLGQHDESTSESMVQLLEEKLSAENFYSEKIRYLEGKNSKLKEQVKELERRNKLMSDDHNNELNHAEKIREEDIQHYKNREYEWQANIQKELEQMKKHASEDVARDSHSASELSALIQKLNALLFTQSKPNYKQAEEVIKTLQHENHALRTQTDHLNE